MLASSPALTEEARSDDGMAPRHREFLETVAPLIGDTERDVFLQLGEDYRRDAFVRRFWRTRDPYPDTPRNELRERWEENALGLASRLAEAEGEQKTLLLLHGEPRRTFRDSCQLLRPLDIWYYPSSPIVPAEFYAIFLRTGSTTELWRPQAGVDDLLFGVSVAFGSDEVLERIQTECARGDDILRALTLSLDWDSVHERALRRPDEEWALAFLERSAQGADPDGEGTMDVHHAYVGRRQSRTVVQSTLRLDPAAAVTDATPLLVDGEIVRQGELFDTFRYRFEVPVDGGTTPPLTIERYLRPGGYRLVLHVRDIVGDRAWAYEGELEVPPFRVRDAGTAELVTSSIGEGTGAGDDPGPDAGDGDAAAVPASIRLAVPNRELLIGPFRAEAFVEGDGIHRVAFELDGEPVLSKASPPYSVELDAGRVPRPHQLVAVATDSAGAELARDEVTVNAGPQRFSVRLLEPRRGGSYEGTVRAVAEVDVPPIHDLDSVEFFLNDRRMATLYQRPFAVPIPIPTDEALAFVRVVARLRDGTQTEDLVFVNSPHEVEYLDVDLVEVYTTVTNRRGLPIEGLEREDFTILEDGSPQEIAEFRLVRDMPVNACVLFDTSTSMMERLEEAEGAALHFFQLVLRESDRACLVTFNDVHEVVVDFTNDPEVLAGGLEGLVAEGETALYDSLIHTLYLFNGMRGRRALILLSDGADSQSEYRFQEVLDFARRSEVTVYVIGVDIDSRDIAVRSQLSELAADTGGRTFFIDTVRELKRVYSLIEEELRSQYLLAYQSSSTGDRDRFREIEVEVGGRGLRARTLSGYYP